MKHPPAPPASESALLRAKLADDEQQLDAWHENENNALSQLSELQGQLADLQRTASAADAAALAKKSAALRRQIEEAQAGLNDARAIGDRLERDIASIRQKLVDADTIEQRHRAVQAVAELDKLAGPVERAAAELVDAIRALRAAGKKAGAEVREALLALGNDAERMLDYEPLVVDRAAGCGPEMSSAVAGILHDIASASGTAGTYGAGLDHYVTFNDFVSYGQSPSSAVAAAVAVVASRLDVKVQP